MARRGGASPANAQCVAGLPSDPPPPPLPLPIRLPVQAFVLYEESIPDSKQEVRALQSIMGTLNRWVAVGGGAGGLQGGAGRAGWATSAASASCAHAPQRLACRRHTRHALLGPTTQVAWVALLLSRGAQPQSR